VRRITPHGALGDRLGQGDWGRLEAPAEPALSLPPAPLLFAPILPRMVSPSAAPCCTAHTRLQCALAGATVSREVRWNTRGGDVSAGGWQ
jgi:hypothetical protein